MKSSANVDVLELKKFWLSEVEEECCVPDRKSETIKYNQKKKKKDNNKKKQNENQMQINNLKQLCTITWCVISFN